MSGVRQYKPPLSEREVQLKRQLAKTRAANRAANLRKKGKRHAATMPENPAD